MLELGFNSEVQPGDVRHIYGRPVILELARESRGTKATTVLVAMITDWIPTFFDPDELRNIANSHSFETNSTGRDNGVNP